MRWNPAAILYNADGTVAISAATEHGVTRLAVENSPHNVHLDAYARMRVANPISLFEFKAIDDASVALMWASSVSGTGSSLVFQKNRASFLLSTGTGTGATVVRQTRRRWNHQAGKSFLILWSAIMAPVASVRKEVGYFDNNDGVMLRAEGSAVSWVRRSGVTGSPVDTVVAQSAWNVDKLDGTGASGTTLDFTKIQIPFVQFGWIGGGAVECGFYVEGRPIVAHRFLSTNLLTSVYMRTPNLFLRGRIQNLGGGAAASLEWMAGAVYSDGGQDPFFLPRAGSRGAGTVTLNTGNARMVLQIRHKTGKTEIPIQMSRVSLLTTSNANYEWFLALNGTTDGSVAPSWVAVPNSATEFDITETGEASPAIEAQNVLAHGFGTSEAQNVLAHGFGTSEARDAIQDIRSLSLIGEDTAGTRDRMTLFARRLSGGTISVTAGMQWLEVL